MPSRKGLLAHPRCYLAEGGTWPDGPFNEEPPELLQAAKVTRRTLDAFEARGLTPTKAAHRTGVSRKTIINIINGETWFDLPTIERLERTLNVSIWGRSHPQR